MKNSLSRNQLNFSKSTSSLPESHHTAGGGVQGGGSTTRISHHQPGVDTLRYAKSCEYKIHKYLETAYQYYNNGSYKDALHCCEESYELDAYHTDNLLLLGAIHFQLRNFSESIFYNQQCIRIDPTHAESFSNMGNALKELGDIQAAIQFYLKVPCHLLGSSHDPLSLSWGRQLN